LFKPKAKKFAPVKKKKKNVYITNKKPSTFLPRKGFSLKNVPSRRC